MNRDEQECALVARMNDWVNRPEWHTTFNPNEDVSFAKFFNNPDNCAFWHPNGQGLAIYFAARRNRGFDNVYIGHAIFGPGLRGAEALDFSRACVNEVFTAYGASSIFGEIRRDNAPARAMVRALGLKRIGYGSDPFNRPTVQYVMTRGMWVTARAKDGSKWAVSLQEVWTQG